MYLPYNRAKPLFVRCKSERKLVHRQSRGQAIVTPHPPKHRALATVQITLKSRLLTI